MTDGSDESDVEEIPPRKFIKPSPSSSEDTETAAANAAAFFNNSLSTIPTETESDDATGPTQILLPPPPPGVDLFQHVTKTLEVGYSHIHIHYLDLIDYRSRILIISLFSDFKDHPKQ